MDTRRLSTIQIDDHTEPGIQGQSNSLARLLEQLFGLVRRQFLLIFFIVALTTGIGVVYLMTLPVTYTAHAKLIIDSSKARALQQQTMPTPGLYVPIDFTEVMTQLEILKSDNLALSVIKAQHLTQNPAFVGGTGEGLLQSVFARIIGPSNSGTVTPSDTRSESELTRAALGTLLAQRTITRVGDTYVLDIGYTALDPNLAPKMANDIANAYIDDQLESKYQTTQHANVWLQERIKDLRAQAEAADRAVSDYKEKNKIIDIGGGGRLLGDDQVAQLNTQLSNLRVAAAEAKARLDRINDIMKEDIPDAGTTDSLNSGIIGRLRNQYLDLASRERIYSARYGHDHLAVVNIRTQMFELRRSITDELNRIAQSYKSEYEIDQARAQTIQASIAGLVANSQLVNRDRIGLVDLETKAKIYHSLYDNFLNRFMEQSQQQSFPITESRVISAAQSPGARSGPNTHNILASAVFLGVILGFGAGILRETLDRVFRTRHQVEQILRTNCLAVLPHLTKSAAVARADSDDAEGVHEQGGSGKKFVTDEKGLFSRVIDEPRSLFAEGFRSIKVAADIASAIKENKIIGVTSSVPKEGKSTTACNLAELMAHAGKRVILIDGDLRNLTLSRGLARKAKTGLLEVLAGQVDLQHVLYTDRRSGLSFLPAVIDSRLAHTDEIISSKMFRQLLDELRKDHDYIIVDLPPLAPVSDARATAGIIDSYIYVIEWGRTKINVVQHQLATAPELSDRLLGVVLSKANINILTRYEHYYGRNYYKNYDAQYGYGS